MSDRTSTVRVNVLMDSSGGVRGALGFGKAIGAAALGVGALAVGVGFGANKLYDFGDAADDADAKIANVVKTMGIFGKHAAEVTQRIEDQAKATSLATAVDINSIKATQAKLLTFKELAKSAGNVNGQFNRATKAAVDMAALGFGTAETNAVQLGKALNDPVKGITALTRSGITFTESEKARIKTMVESNQIADAQVFILGAIEKQVKGTAEATAGGFELMKNRLSIFGQELATKALPYLDRFGNFMITTGGPAIVQFAQGANRAATALGERMAPTVAKVSTFIREKAVPALIEFAGWVQDHVVPAIVNYVTPALEGARKGFDKVAASVRKNGPELKDMGDKLQRIAEFILDKVAPVMGRFAGTNLAVLGAAISGAITVLSDMWSAWSRIVSIIESAIGKVNAFIAAAKKIPGGGLLAEVVGRTAGGGGTSMADIADIKGQTAVTPRIVINFNGAVTDPRGAAREVEKILRRNTVSTGRAVYA